jgi:signal transduction histidine kinase
MGVQHPVQHHIQHHVQHQGGIGGECHAAFRLSAQAEIRSLGLLRRPRRLVVRNVTEDHAGSGTGEHRAARVRGLAGWAGTSSSGEKVRPGSTAGDPASAADRRLAEAAHDMRQPLATIRYLLEMAGDDGAAAATHVLVNEISKHVEYLTQLTEHLLSEPASARASVDLVRLLRDAVATVQAELAKTAVRVEWVTPQRLTVPADEVALHRAVVNLVQNAVRAAAPAGQVRISLARRPGLVQLDVEDSGPGMGADVPPGTGGGRPLGLFITDRLVRAHNGQLLDVGPSADLGGAAVRMLLPTS